ncbi:NAD(P)H-binding protein [Cognatishimia sp. SS12]|uniref:NAD(P)H-binding protein n=1 Tax=Cognatishimia sp. SS12 TaxID=2979465 RepID=UPI00232B3C79|nr:NAD(P)H-binding protein [Cognatishimia sp. SS12]MDC0737972.1 NAD(P)H-binding protein [Cognatishimia sp. SS12]
MTKAPLHIVILGATGAVGTEVVRALVAMDHVAQITLLTRRPFTALQSDKITEHHVDPLDPDSYAQHLAGHSVAICTLGVGAVSSVSRAEFRRVDHDAVVAFGSACDRAGIAQFQLLSSVGASPTSGVFYLRSKGELEAALKAMNFERLSLFHPSNILTPENRYGIGQALVLALWPKLTPLLAGPLRKYRGIKVETLGRAIAQNSGLGKTGAEVLEWDDFQRLASVRA